VPIEIRSKYSNGILLSLEADSLRYANLQNADLRDASLRGANLQGANLTNANLQCADLRYANLQGANLQNVNLTAANLTAANLSTANLQNADLRDASLRDADLTGANLSGAKGLLNASEWITKNLQQTPEGIICFKCIGGTDFPWPKHWPEPKPGAILTEIVNPCLTSTCASGVNVATEAWCRNNYPNSALWKCLIRWEWMIDAVVPYQTDGKFRAAKVQLLEQMSKFWI